MGVEVEVLGRWNFAPGFLMVTDNVTLAAYLTTTRGSTLRS